MTNQIYSNNRQNLIDKLPEADVIFIAGNGQLSRTGDTNYTYRQDSNVIYLSGLDKLVCSLLIDVKNRKNYIVAPKISKIEEIFEGKPDWPRLIETSGLDDIITEQNALNIIKNSKIFYMNLPAKPLYFGLYSNPNRARWLRRINSLGVKPNDARPALAELRMIKQPYEITNIKKAVNITKKSLKELEDNIYAFKSELAIVNKITANFALSGVEHAYRPIVASGVNASVLHHNSTDNKIQNNSCLLFDVGAEYKNYASDISRTLLVGKNDLIKELIIDVKNVQNNIVNFVKPGLSWQDIQKYSNEQLQMIIIKHNLGNPKDIKKLFPHAIGHFVGLDTHDTGNYKVPLKENMAITIEPGLYDTNSGFGVRVEDVILITADSAKIL